MQNDTAERILVAGGGPVGMLSALSLAQQGIPVVVFEEHKSLRDDPRAATTHPSTLEMLDDLGILDKVESQGLHCRKFRFWDRLTGDMVAEFDHDALKDDCLFPYVVQCEQFKIATICMQEALKFSHTEILFSHNVVDVRQSDDQVVATVETPDGTQEFSGAYLIGADGGRSAVRKAMDIKLEGFTYQERFLVLSTPYDFTMVHGDVYRNYFFDPDEWCNLFKVAADGPPGLWRAVFPTNNEQTDEEILSHQSVQARMQKFFPKKGEYDLVHKNIYKIHQRVAETFRKGRVFLAGDSAHLNNPIGGMGLNGGIHDAVNLTEKLGRVWKGEGDASLFELYDRQRRIATTEFVQAQTIRNKKMLEEKDMDVRQKRMDEMRKNAADPTLAREFLLRSSLIASVRRAAEIT